MSEDIQRFQRTFGIFGSPSQRRIMWGASGLWHPFFLYLAIWGRGLACAQPQFRWLPLTEFSGFTPTSLKICFATSTFLLKIGELVKSTSTYTSVFSFIVSHLIINIKIHYFLILDFII